VYSGHADQDMLLRWTRDRLPVAKRVFLTHGEEGARTAFQQVLKATDIPEEKISLPMLDDTVILKKGTLHIAQNKPRLSGEELSRDDWHNMYAGTITALSDKLRSMSTPAERQKLLEKVLRDIGSV
jgi:metallo-beta-lactamase family protein